MISGIILPNWLFSRWLKRPTRNVWRTIHLLLLKSFYCKFKKTLDQVNQAPIVDVVFDKSTRFWSKPIMFDTCIAQSLPCLCYLSPILPSCFVGYSSSILMGNPSIWASHLKHFMAGQNPGTSHESHEIAGKNRCSSKFIPFKLIGQEVLTHPIHWNPGLPWHCRVNSSCWLLQWRKMPLRDGPSSSTPTSLGMVDCTGAMRFNGIHVRVKKTKTNGIN